MKWLINWSLLMKIGMTSLSVLAGLTAFMLSCSDEKGGVKMAERRGSPVELISDHDDYTQFHLVSFPDGVEALVVLTKGSEDMEWTSMFQIPLRDSDVFETNLGLAQKGFGFPYTPSFWLPIISWDDLRAQVPPDLDPVELSLGENAVGYAMRVVDWNEEDDTEKVIIEEESQYYALLRDDPYTVYAISCQNFFNVFTGRNFDAEANTIPINRSLLDRITAATGGPFKLKVVSCYDAKNGEESVTERFPDPTPAPQIPYQFEWAKGELWNVEYFDFDEEPYYPRPKTLFFVQEDAEGNKRSYPIDCSNADIMSIVGALGFTLNDIIEHPVDEDFFDTLPQDGETQVALRCDRDKYNMFKSENEIPEASYYQTDVPGVLIEYTCEPIIEYFEERAIDVLYVPKEAVGVAGLNPGILGSNPTGTTVEIVRIGCKDGPRDPGCEMSETTCDDGEDNDCDGLIDCADENCSDLKCGPFGFVCDGTSCVCSGGQSMETTCDDGIDNDCNGATDCADVNCEDEACADFGYFCESLSCNCSGGQSSESTCNDGKDNDCDGKKDCSDSNCNGKTCGSNGKKCAGTSCKCPGGTEETTCNDGKDNDCDGKKDCSDSNCNGKTCGSNGKKCAGTSCKCPGGTKETNCSDGKDNDCDGKTDCADSDCNQKSCGSYSRCCSGKCVSLKSKSNCGACGINCGSNSCVQNSSHTGNYICACDHSNAQCRDFGYGSSATCWDTNGTPYTRCNCQCPDGASTCKGQCAGGATCHDVSGINYCSY